LVGDGPDVLAFSILVEGLHGRSLAAVRGAQVTCVNAMMRYVREAHGIRNELGPEATPLSPTPDVESGEEVGEGQEELPLPQPPAGTTKAPAPADRACCKQGAAPAPLLPRFIPAAPH
jgi:hypothetical protein